jgi:ATPase subunit of ABC transporter with duplicated ATPase domains
LLASTICRKGLKGEIKFLKEELESMQVAVQKVSNTLPDQIDQQDRIWARDLRELSYSYDIEDKVDEFMVRVKGNDPAELNGVKGFIGRSFKLFSKFRIRHGLATEIKDIKRRAQEVSRRHKDYKITNHNSEPVKMDPRLFAQYKNVRELIGIDEAREEVIKILKEGSEVSKQQDKIVSIVGFGGLGKTTLANVVYEELKTQFESSAFVSVSQTPDMLKLPKDMLCQVKKGSDSSTNIVKELTEFLQKKRYGHNT